MKNLLLCFVMAVSLNLSAQSTQKQIELPIKYYDALKVIKANKDFAFLEIPDTVTGNYNGTALQSIIIDNDNFKFECHNNIEVKIIDKREQNVYYLNIIQDTFVGYAMMPDVKLNRMFVRYYNGKKTVDEVVIKFN